MVFNGAGLEVDVDVAVDVGEDVLPAVGDEKAST